MSSDITPFLRHLEQCNTAIIPGKRAPFSLAGKVAGWITPELFDRLEKEGLGNRATSFNLPDPSKLEALGEALAQEGFYRSHHELFDVRTDVGKPAIARIDRGALPLFGLVATGVHMNAGTQSRWPAPMDRPSCCKQAAGSLQTGPSGSWRRTCWPHTA